MDRIELGLHSNYSVFIIKTLLIAACFETWSFTSLGWKEKYVWEEDMFTQKYLAWNIINTVD